VELPADLDYIGWQAFDPCKSLTEVKVAMKEPVEIRENTFPSRANATLYVPAGSKTAFESTQYWKDFKQIVEMGDVNGDYQLNVADITLLVNIINGADVQQDVRRAADVNGDGEVTTADVELLLDDMLGIEDENKQNH
jgi:hypothetical protein